ncbi:MAG: PAS domain-containing sensor histidine kinase [Acidimicrobiales bacterium]|nr:MAG: PAS domain-containing sensor histidine kinase [Acidimicrobiales bacterium]
MNKHSFTEKIENIEVLIGLLDLLPSPVYIKDKNHIWVAVNNAFCEFLGYPAEKLIGKSDFDYNPAEQAQVFWDADNRVLDNKEDSLDIEETTNSRGDLLWVESRKSYYETSNGEPYIIGVITDITELELQKKAALEAERKAKLASVTKSEFLANMSHEIRTPMNGIMGMAELLLNTKLTPRQTDFANTINQSGHALLTIINDILDFSKAEACQIELEQTPFHLRNCIEDVTALLASTVNDKDLDLLVRIQPDLHLSYVGDVGRVRQILTNIIGNAVKFTSEGHVLIDVDGETRNGITQLKIQVIDTGIGIAPDKLGTIFEKFSQADGSTTREYGGTGLGLSISKQLTELMGGEISVSSDLDKGTSFSISLPLEITNVITDDSKKNIDISISGSNILIIDDNSINLNILTEQLRHWKCKTIAVDSAQMGLSVLKQAFNKGIKIDLVIVDYQMPIHSGEDFYLDKQKDSDIADIPVIMLSSVDSTELRNRMGFGHISSFLSKPAKSSVLYNAIVDIIYGLDKRSIPIKSVSVKSKSDSFHSRNTDSNHVDILIAEDNEVNQKYASYVMEELGLTYVIVPNGKMAIDKWQLLSPSAILMDISMPKMNGYDATKVIRQIEKDRFLSPTPIIAVTAHSMKGDDKICLQKGMDDYLSKPLSKQSLKECLVKWGVCFDAKLQAAHK